jgi:GntR family transcriptional repressor for pyruvate dehydrogenase complex
MSRSDDDSQSRATASERVADVIREWMFSLNLKPGERLGHEEELAERFGVSRPTLREALKELSSAHLIRAAKGRGGGIFVAATGEGSISMVVTDSVKAMLLADSIDMQELMETRVLLEVPLTGMAAARATESDVAELRALLAPADPHPPDPEALPLIDNRLHERIAALAGDRLSSALMQWVVSVAQGLLFEIIEEAVVTDVVYDQLESIVRAIERGDPPGAERAMKEHLVYLSDALYAITRRDATR